MEIMDEIIPVDDWITHTKSYYIDAMSGGLLYAPLRHAQVHEDRSYGRARSRRNNAITFSLNDWGKWSWKSGYLMRSTDVFRSSGT